MAPSRTSTTVRACVCVYVLSEGFVCDFSVMVTVSTVTGPLSEPQIAYTCREMLQVSSNTDSPSPFLHFHSIRVQAKRILLICVFDQGLDYLHTQKKIHRDIKVSPSCPFCPGFCPTVINVFRAESTQ